MTLTDIEAKLKEPFALDDIDFLPKKNIEKDGKTLCMAFPFADPRVYQDRLNAIAYGEWNTPAPTVIAVGNRLVCYVTVVLCGVSHTDVGEAVHNDKEENTGTEAWSQAFKRACSHFGLGRYLYELEKEWVPYNVQRKQIDLDAAGKRAIVRKMYQKAGIVEKASEKPVTSQSHQNTSSPSQTHSAPSGDVVEASAEEIKKQIDTVQSLLAAHYQIPMINQPAKWKKFKELVLGLPVEDEGLDLAEVKRLREAIDLKIEKAKGAA